MRAIRLRFRNQPPDVGSLVAWWSESPRTGGKRPRFCVQLHPRYCFATTGLAPVERSLVGYTMSEARYFRRDHGACPRGAFTGWLPHGEWPADRKARMCQHKSYSQKLASFHAHRPNYSSSSELRRGGCHRSRRRPMHGDDCRQCRVVTSASLFSDMPEPPSGEWFEETPRAHLSGGLHSR